MIDTHAHLTKRFCPAGAGQAIKHPGVKEIDAVILAASNTAESAENVELAKNNPGKYWAAAGIHPQQTDPENQTTIDQQINFLDELIAKERQWIVAVGECGLDYSTPPPPEKERTHKDQEILFRGQIALCLKHQLPLMIHARKAVDEVIEILKSYQSLRGVWHCYTGGKKRIQKILDLAGEWYFGFDGNLTYEEGLAEVAAAIAREKIVLETDSPFLSPLPFRGQINRPDNVVYVYKKLAEIWKKPLAETEKIVDSNAKILFGL